MDTTSVWSKTASARPQKPLPGDITVHTAIVGGGMAGILTAYMLKQKGVECVALEAEQIGSGQTGNTTAKITFQHNLICDWLLNTQGEERAGQYFMANQAAIREYREIVRRGKIDCEWKECSAFLYTIENWKNLVKEYEAAQKLGIPAKFTEETELPFAVRGALEFPGQAMFHPLQFLYKIAEGLTIYENTCVKKAEGQILTTNRGTVQAENIIFTCHFPFFHVPGYFFIRMWQERSYVLALEHAANLKHMYLGIDKSALSFRMSGEMLLLGGGGHRTGENEAGGQYEHLRQKAREYWPDAAETARWSAQDCMTVDKIPYIGRLGSEDNNWYAATGFGKWGMTSSMVAANLISDSICGKVHPCAKVFSAKRVDLKGSAAGFAKQGTHAAGDLLRQVTDFPSEEAGSLRIGEGKIVEYKGEKVGAYKDEDGRIFAVHTRCPHLGCQLEWNPEEKSWDCPCHGSRFDFKGELLNGPAQTHIYLSPPFIM